MKSWKPFHQDNESINSILDMVYGYQRSRVLFTACELDVFYTLGTDANTVDEISMILNTDKRATQRLLDALCGIGLLEKVEGKYSNSNISLRFLVKNKPEYMSIMDYSNMIWKSWSELTSIVKNGKSLNIKALKDYSEKEVESFIDSVHWRSALLAPEIVKSIDLKNVNSILDIGGGVGDYSIEFIRAKPDIKATIFTFPNYVKYTKEYLEYIKHPEITNNIEIIEGDICSDTFGSGYDLVFSSFVVQHYDIWQNIDMVKRIYDSLNSKGRLVIQDFLINDDRTSPEFNALYALELLVSSEKGDIFTESDIWLILKEAWFKNIQSENTEFGTSLISAEKI